MTQLTQRIVELYAQGHTTATIAREVDRSRQRVHQIIVGSGHHRPMHLKLAERRRAVASLTRAGLMGTQIAIKVGVSPETVYKDKAVARIPRSRSWASIKKRRGQVALLARQGLNGAQIAQHLGCNRKTIYRDLKCLGGAAVG